jgi:hypothetical protein
VYVWASFVLIIALIFEGSEFTGGIQLFLLGIPFIITLSLLQTNNKELGELYNDVAVASSGQKAFVKLRDFMLFFEFAGISDFNLLRFLDSERKAHLGLIGYLFQHKDTCKKKNCPLHKLKMENLNEENSIAKTKLTIEKKELLQNLLQTLFQRNMKRSL